MKYLKTFSNDIIDFVKEMNESFDSQIKDINWTVNDSDYLEGEFNVDILKYKIYISKYGNDIWTFKFSVINNDGFETQELVNNRENKMIVLNTIKSSMNYFIKMKNPNGIILSIVDGSRGRKNLYTIFANELCKQYNFNVRTIEIARNENIIISNNIITDNDIKDVLTMIYMNYINLNGFKTD